MKFVYIYGQIQSLQSKQNKDIFLSTSVEHVRASFLYHLMQLSTCFLSIFCSKILSCQGGSMFCRATLCHLRGFL